MHITVFADALQHNDIKTVTKALDAHPDFLNHQFQGPNDSIIRPIHIAAIKGYTALVLLLAERGADVNEPVTVVKESVQRQRTPLFWAYESQNLQTAVALIKHGARCYVADDHAREVNAFNAAAANRFALIERIENMRALGGPSFVIAPMERKRDEFDSYLQAIKTRGGKLSRRIPKASAANGAILNDDYLAFGEVVNLVCALKNGVASDSSSKDPGWLIADFLDKTDGSWPDIAKKLRVFLREDALDFRDAVNAFTEVVVLPELARKSRNLLQAGKIDISEVKRELAPVVAQAIIGDRGLSVVIDLSTAWHRDRPILEATIRQPEFVRQGEWPALTKEYHASNGLTVSFVTSAKALEILGDEQAHCVGGYTDICLNEPIHIGVIKDGDTVLSTFEVKEAPRDKSLISITQHKRAANASVPASSPEANALGEFQDAVANKRVTIDFKALSTSRSKREKEQTDIRYICGFDPFREDQDYATNALRAYIKVRTGGRHDSRVKASNSFVPGGAHAWGNSSAHDFLEQTGIMKKIDEILADPPLVETENRYRGY